MRPLLIGICGRSCSGKSTVSKRLEELYKDFLHINQDSFFKKGLDNYENPESLMMDKFIDSLKKLREGDSIYIPTWKDTENKLVSSKKIIIVEGFLLFIDEEIVDLFDKKIFVDVSDEILLKRRIKRSADIYDTFEYTKNVCIPESKKYEQIQKERADVVIDGNQSKENILKEVEEYLNTNNLIKIKR